MTASTHNNKLSLKDYKHSALFAKNRIRQLLLSTTLSACLLLTSPSFADMVVERTINKTTPEASSTQTITTTKWNIEEHSTMVNGARVINFMEFDLNKNNIMSIDEVGQMLFQLFDTDGNDLIDNIEFEHRAVVTIMPIEKNTTVYYDFNGDGIADTTKYTYETFARDTLLAKFDKNRDGLSPHEFMGTDFMAADIDNDHFVDLNELRGSYIASLDKENKKDALYPNK